MTKQSDEEFICLSRCGKAFKTIQARHVHEDMCIECGRIEQSIQPLQTETLFNKDKHMEDNTTTYTLPPTNGISEEAWVDAIVTAIEGAQEKQDSHAVSPDAVPLASFILTELRKAPSTPAQPLLVRVGPQLVGIASIALITIRKDSCVDVTLNALQITNAGRTESISFMLEEDEGAALIASLEPVTTSAPSGILEKLRGQGSDLRAAQQKVHELEAEIERHIKERETAMDIALKADEELNRYKKVLSQLTP